MKQPKQYIVKLRTVPPIATDPRDHTKMRLVKDGEDIILVRKITEGVIVSLLDDNYIAIVSPDEIHEDK